MPTLSQRSAEGFRRGWMIFILVAGLITAAAGCLALLGWYEGYPLLTDFGTGLIAMAPSTAVLFLLYGAAIGLRARSPLSGRKFRFSGALVCLGMLAALVLFMLGCLGIHWNVEHIGLNIIDKAGVIPQGHMSPLSSFCFLLAGASFLASLSRVPPPAWRTVLARGTAGVVSVFGIILLLAYLYGTPLLYSGTFIPPALNSVLTFTLLGLALLALAGRHHGPIRKAVEARFKPSFVITLIFILLAAGIVVTGYFFFRNYEKHYLAGIEQQLAAIADLKENELVQWRNARMSDGTLFLQNPAFSASVKRFFDNPDDAEARSQLHTWISHVQAAYWYDQIRLLDTQGVTHLAVPASQYPPSAMLLQDIPKVLHAGREVFRDFCRDERDQRIYLAVLVPLFDGADNHRPLGVLMLRINPKIYLYPFIARWPTPSRTAETLLVRREGDGIVFLNELRYQTNTALMVRHSLAETNYPSVRAALGQEGILHGVTDYRGVPVLAEVRAIPDTPWFMVSRIDMAEILAPLRERLWLVLGLVGLLLFGAGSSVGLVWRQQHIRFYREQALAAAALRASTQKYQDLFKSSRDALMTLEPPAWRFTSGNLATVALFAAKDEADFTARGPWELSPEWQPDGRASEEKAREMIETALRDGSHFFEWTHRRITGEDFPATVLLSRMQSGEKLFLQATVRDITDRKQAETYAVMAREILQMLNEPGALQATLQRIMAAVQLRTGLDAVGVRLQVGDDFPYIAQQGFSKNFLLTENTLLERGPEGGVCRDKEGHVKLECTCGLVISGKTNPASSLFTQGGSFWTNDSFPLLDLPPNQDPRLHPRNTCMHQGYASMALVPIWNKDKIVGLIHLNDRRKGCFTLAILESLEGIAAQIGTALIRKQAEENLASEQSILNSLISTIPDHIYFKDRTSRFILINPAQAAALGLRAPQEALGKSDADFFSAEHAHKAYVDEQQLMTTGLPLIGIEERETWPDGSVTWVSTTKVALRNPAGEIIGLVGISRDITEHKQAEVQRKKIEAQKRQLQKAESLGCMASAIAHRYNNWLQVVCGELELVAASPALDADMAESLNAALQTAREAAQMSRMMLTYMGHDSQESEPLDLAELCRRSLPLLQTAMSIVLGHDLPTPGPVINANANQIKQVLTNLVTNAWEAGEASRNAVRLAVTTVTLQEIPTFHRFPTDWQPEAPAYACLAVVDTGQGVAEADIEKLFDPFYSTKFLGRGLGLAVVLGIVRAHYGVITVESELGHGSAFRVYFPIAAHAAT